MLTAAEDMDGERVLTVRVPDAAIDAGLLSALDAAVDRAERAGVDAFALLFSGGPEAVTGDFPSWRAGPGRDDMRYFARWDETLARISRLRAKTFAGYHGRVGAAAVQAGLVVDLRLASAQAVLRIGGLAEGRFPGTGAYWLPKYVGLGTARRMLLLGADLTAADAAGLGLVDVIEDTLDAAADAAIKAMRAVTPEAARLTRRILDDAYVLERGAAAELAKAARYKVGMPQNEGPALMKE